MIKKICFSLFVFLLVSESHAYTRSQLKLSKHEYVTIAKPQMRNIYNDYQNLLYALNPEIKKYKKIFGLYQNLLLNQQKLTQFCQLENNEQCSSIINSVLKDTQKIMSELAFNDDSLTSNNDWTSLERIQLFNQHKMSLFEYYLDLFNFHFLYRAEIDSPLEIISYQKKTLEIFYQFHLLLISYTPYQYQERLHGVWSQFIQPITSKILILADIEVFLSQINSLNISLNVFNASMTKRNVNVDKKIKTILTIMQTRWNNILKATLR